MKYKIPVPKTKIVLAKDWTIDIFRKINGEIDFYTKANNERLAMCSKNNGNVYYCVTLPLQHTFPAGTEFIVSKIYVRNNGYGEHSINLQYKLLQKVSFVNGYDGVEQFNKITFVAYLDDFENAEWL